MDGKSLYGPQLKLARARSHLNHLPAEEATFFRSQEAIVFVDVDKSTGHRLAKFRSDGSPPELVYVLAGEIIYQLRSTLDQIAVVLARNSKAAPDVKKIYFPTGSDRNGFRASVRRNLRGVDSRFVKAILRLKPYDGGNDLLRAVFRLANVDKHLELIPIAFSGNISGIQGLKIVGPRPMVIGSPKPMNEGVAFADLGVAGSIEKLRPDASVSITGHIAFGNTPVFDGKPIVTSLDQMISSVEDALQTFSAMITPPIYFTFADHERRLVTQKWRVSD